MSRERCVLIFSLLLPLLVYSDSRPSASMRWLAEADRLALLYNWPRAAHLYAQAEDAFEQSRDRRNALAARLGSFRVLADAGVRLDVREEVARYFEDPLVRADPALRLRALVTHAVLDRNVNEASARESWEQILELAEDLGDKGWRDRAKAEIGQILFLDGDLRAATEMFQEAVFSLYLRLDLGAALYYTAMAGGGFTSAGRPETGLEYANRALRMAYFVKDLGVPYLAYQGKASALIALGRPAEAEEILAEVLPHARSEQNYFALSQLLIVAGTAAAAREPNDAMAYLEEAVAVNREKGFQHVLAWSAFELATLHRAMGDFESAELLALESNQIMRDLEDRYHFPLHLILLADLKARRGAVERADELYTEAADVIDALLAGAQRRTVQGSLIAALSGAYIGHFELAAAHLSDPVKAYAVIETARGRSLADTLREGPNDLWPVNEDAVAAFQEINRIQRALLHETDRQSRQGLLDDLFQAEQRLSPERRPRPLLNPGMARSAPIPLSTLQASLGIDEMMLEYVLGETQSYCLRITRSGIDVVVLPAGRAYIEDLVERYRTGVLAAAPDMAASQELFALVLEPVIEMDSIAQLVIVPDGKLHLLPFDALQDRNGRYVLESHIVTYAPSATVLHLLRESGSSDHATRDFLGVGGVPYSGLHAAGVFRSADLFSLESAVLPDLHGSVQEVAGAASVIPGGAHLLLAEDATEAALKALPLEEFRVIHFAVHGVADTVFPDRAALVLGNSPESGEDGLLQAREIRNLSLRADLVTLSACDTGSGRLLGQEGIASLERAFLLAGARAVIASLWPADDTVTVVLMHRMYQHLAAGAAKGAALRQAKLDLLEELQDQARPEYWAGFTLVGEGSASIFD